MGFRGSVFEVWGSWFGVRVSGFAVRVSGFGFRILGSGFQVSDFGFRFSDLGFRETKSPGRLPSAKHSKSEEQMCLRINKMLFSRKKQWQKKAWTPDLRRARPSSGSRSGSEGAAHQETELQEYLAHKKAPDPLRPPLDPRQRPTVGS